MSKKLNPPKTLKNKKSKESKEPKYRLTPTGELLVKIMNYKERQLESMQPGEYKNGFIDALTKVEEIFGL